MKIEDLNAGADQNGADVLDDVHAFLRRFVAYPGDHGAVAHALWVAHAHLMDAWNSTPRIAFLSPEPGSGKTRALEATELLVPNPVSAVNVSPAYLFRKVADPAGLPTILFDEIDTVFGPKAKDNEDTRGLLNAGHRRGAVAGRCVVKGRNVETEELPAYCAVALAGLGALPDTILTRSIVVRMKRRAPTEHVDPYRRRVHEPEGVALRDRLARWADEVRDDVRDAWPTIPIGIEDRNADVWEPLLAVAEAAGGNWPKMARDAAVALVAAAMRGSPSLGLLLLSDIRNVFDKLSGADNPGDVADNPGDVAITITTADLLAALTALDESPWGDLRGKPLDARGLSRRLSEFQVSPTSIRVSDEKTLKGYKRDAFYDAWLRYLPEQGAKANEPKGNEDGVADVPDVPAAMGDRPKAATTKASKIYVKDVTGEDHVGRPPEESGTSGTNGTNDGAAPPPKPITRADLAAIGMKFP